MGFLNFEQLGCVIASRVNRALVSGKSGGGVCAFEGLGRRFNKF